MQPAFMLSFHHQQRRDKAVEFRRVVGVNLALQCPTVFCVHLAPSHRSWIMPICFHKSRVLKSAVKLFTAYFRVTLLVKYCTKTSGTFIVRWSTVNV